MTATEWDEVGDPEWLLAWSLAQNYEQRRRGGYYFGPMYTFKAVDPQCNEETEDHVSCWDSPASTARQDCGWTFTVITYPDEGPAHREYMQDTPHGFYRHRNAA